MENESKKELDIYFKYVQNKGSVLFLNNLFLEQLVIHQISIDYSNRENSNWMCRFVTHLFASEMKTFISNWRIRI